MVETLHATSLPSYHPTDHLNPPSFLHLWRAIAVENQVDFVVGFEVN
ncbi:hypothetical protein [Coleofasciculus sp.]